VDFFAHFSHLASACVSYPVEQFFSSAGDSFRPGLRPEQAVSPCGDGHLCCWFRRDVDVGWALALAAEATCLVVATPPDSSLLPLRVLQAAEAALASAATLRAGAGGSVEALLLVLRFRRLSGSRNDCLSSARQAAL